jgi:xanthine dehydrogenase molybdopterin-binding subunit B
LNADPLKLRQLNLYKKGDTTPSGQPLPYFIVDELINDLIVSSDYVNRLNAVNDFNKNNRWKKKGISLTPIKWGVGWTGICKNVPNYKVNRLLIFNSSKRWLL